MTETAAELTSETIEGSDALLSITELRLRFGGVVALDGPSFDVAAGEICGVIGPNGAGKTTIFNCINRIYTPNSGRITLAGTDVLALRPDQVVGAGLARTFQNLGLFSSQTVIENVMAGAIHSTRAGLVSSALGLPRVRREEREVRARARDLLARLELTSVENHLAAGLPLGTLKRVELARALMAEPRLLMLDEPANGLILDEVNELAEVVLGLRADFGFSVLLIEHHMGMVMQICDHLVVLDFGRKIADGAPSDVRDDPRVVEAYLGAPA